MKISKLMQTLARASATIRQMKTILEDGDPENDIIIERGILQDWFNALLGLKMLLGRMEIEEIKTDK
jgi:hypothetical protein